MRVNKRVVIDIETGAELERESYEYSGALALADPGTIIAGIGAAIAAVSTGVQLSKGSPKEPKPIQAPGADKVDEAAAQMRRRQLTARGFQGNILSDLSSNFAQVPQGQPGLKTTTGA